RPPIGRPGGVHVGHPGGSWHSGWRPYPGWHGGWRWNRGWRPVWVVAGLAFPAWYWINLPYGYYQCTAFDQNMTPFPEIGTTEDQAAYNALYACGGEDYQTAGCYIPEGYCRLR